MILDAKNVMFKKHTSSLSKDVEGLKRENDE